MIAIRWSAYEAGRLGRLRFRACVQARSARARSLTLKREVDVVVPATLTTPREHAPDAGPRGTVTEAQVRLDKAARHVGTLFVSTVLWRRRREDGGERVAVARHDRR